MTRTLEIDPGLFVLGAALGRGLQRGPRGLAESHLPGIHDDERSAGDVEYEDGVAENQVLAPTGGQTQHRHGRRRAAGTGQIAGVTMSIGHPLDGFAEQHRQAPAGVERQQAEQFRSEAVRVPRHAVPADRPGAGYAGRRPAPRPSEWPR